jgi:putative acetyltransferase
MKFVQNLTIRPLGPQDAENFLRLHHAAVHDTASADYAPDILDAWSGPVNAERIASYNRNAGEEVRIGAFDGGIMAGLGVLAPQTGELRACYVHPDYGRMGVGRKIVDALETIAAGMGLGSLTLDSSITAEKFYASLGYETVLRTSHKLADGTNMPAIKMQKMLATLEDIKNLQERNKMIEAEKAWETSWTRRAIIAIVTYIIVAFWLAIIGVSHNLIHALVAVASYLVGMAMLPMIKEHWIERVYRHREAS